MPVNETAADQVYEYVLARLVDGTYAPGELLSEIEVSEAAGLSRTPVREAFLRLQSEGFLRLYPKRGAFVVPVQPGEASDMFTVRLLIETFALDTAATRGTATLIALGASLLESVESSRTAQTDQLRNLEFHRRLVASVENPVLTQLFDQLWSSHLRIALNSASAPGAAEVDTAEHLAIAHALVAGRGGTARVRLEQHLRALLGRSGHVPRAVMLPGAAADGRADDVGPAPARRGEAD